jgi:hypothetical protein
MKHNAIRKIYIGVLRLGNFLKLPEEEGRLSSDSQHHFICLWADSLLGLVKEFGVPHAQQYFSMYFNLQLELKTLIFES